MDVLIYVVVFFYDELSMEIVVGGVRNKLGNVSVFFDEVECD